MLSPEQRDFAQAALTDLVPAVGFIRKPENWMIDVRSDTGYADDDRATAFCALGAIDRAISKRTGLRGREAIMESAESAAVLALDAELPEIHRLQYHSAMPASRVANYNNNSTHATVIAWFDRTIANLRSQLRVDDLERSAVETAALDSSAAGLVKEPSLLAR